MLHMLKRVIVYASAQVQIPQLCQGGDATEAFALHPLAFLQDEVRQRWQVADAGPSDTQTSTQVQMLKF